MESRVCIITGGSSGVGKATAIGLAKLGATIIIISRNQKRGDHIVNEIKSETGNNNIYFRFVDLADFDSIHTFVDQFKKEFNVLHVLSNNAAILPMKKEFTKNGIEKIFAVNYLSHFALTYLLMDLLKSSVPSRVITVSGTPFVLQFGKIDLNDINIAKHFNPIRATFRAAVAKVMFSYELAKRLSGTGVTSNTFHPGLVKSNLTQNFPWVIRIFTNVAQALFTEECKTSVYLAASPEVKEITGKFFKNMKAVDFKPRSDFQYVASSLWDKSIELAGLS